MDIQISSNFERLLFEALGRDGEHTRQLMDSLAQSGSFTLPEKALATIRDGFAANRADEPSVKATMAACYKDCGYLADPHTAVGIFVARQFITAPTPMITLATAHPAKFPDAVVASTGVEPGLPSRLADLHVRPERMDILENNQRAVEDYIKQRTRAWEE